MEPLLAATVKYLALECARLEQELNTDALTGCKSQRAFLKRAREQTSTEGITVIALDIKGLKQINETAGHHEGDKLLCSVVSRLKLNFDECCIYRRGGDEFFIVFEDRRGNPRAMPASLAGTLYVGYATGSRSIGFADLVNQAFAKVEGHKRQSR